MNRTLRTVGKRLTMSEPTPDPESRPPRARRLLLVDDNAEGRRAMARLLEIYGYQVASVGDGQSALKELAETPPPDVVLTDLLLPDMDGREIAKLAASMVPRPLIVMITGWDFGQDPIERQVWGIDEVFLKPLNMSQLVAALSAALEDRP